MRHQLRTLLFCLGFLISSSTFSQNEFWVPLTLPSGNSIYDITSYSDGSIFAAVASRVYRSTDRGSTWTMGDSAAQFGNVEKLTITRLGLLFLACAEGGVYRSTNLGESWENTGSPGGIDAAYEGIASNLLGHIFTCVAGSGVSRTTDDGDHWQNWLNHGLDDLYVRSITTGDHGLVFVGTQEGGIYRSTDNGENWHQVNNGVDGRFITAMGINVNGDVYAANGPHLYRSTDDGEHWSKLDPSAIVDGVVYCFAFNIKGHVYVGALGGGVFASTDNGISWVKRIQGLPTLNISSLAFDNDGYLYTGTVGYGLFRTSSPTTSIEEDGKLPVEFSLEQNYPNPFNPTTTIRFNIPAAEQGHDYPLPVVLKVFDLRGSEVEILVNDTKFPGSYSVSLSSKKMTSGVYFYQITAGSYSQTKKMVFVK